MPPGMPESMNEEALQGHRIAVEQLQLAKQTAGKLPNCLLQSVRESFLRFDVVRLAWNLRSKVTLAGLWAAEEK